ncbi:MAG: aromatic ring-hydroxylating dioxygenase subunit alpha [Pseudomonadota bacterium]|nr:aromatic ring-hydroxylating dioxygenase subunit alpha [Pseudomonadota bacterium]
MNAHEKQSPSSGIRYQELLDQETVPVPAHLRQTRNPDIGTMRLDPANYTSAEQHRLEMAHLWMKTWQFACREEDIPEVGDHLLYEVGDLSLIVVRSGADDIKAFFNSCLHRGRRLVSEAGCKQSFRCPYHAWTWNLDGSNKFIPCKSDFAHAGEEELRLPEARVGRWQGFVFVNPDADCGPLEDFLQVLPAHLDRYDLADCYKALHIAKVIHCNWKAALEAFMESYHVIATHPQLLTFMGDANAQYDLLSDHVSRSITANAVTSPHMEPPPQQQVMEDTLRESGRVFTAGELAVPEGMSARTFLAALNREQFGELFRRDFSDATDAELLDAILYWLFPNIEIWGGYLANIVYRSRPNGQDPDSCIFEIMVLQRVPTGDAKPRGVPVHVLGEQERFSDAEELGVLGKVFDQDLDNLPDVQRGLKVAAMNGAKGLILGNYQESRILQLHQMIERQIRGGKAPA